MPVAKVVLLACGSFNPPTNMHLRMFEIARDHLHRLGSCVVIGGLISPVHDAYGKADLVSSTHRLAMLKLALKTSNWIKLSEWETQQETWTRTRATLQYHQNNINSIVSANNINENEASWLPDNLKTGISGPVQVRLLCGADLLESFGTPGLWSEDDMDAIVGQHGLVVITRENCKPLQFIYNSDILTKYMSNIIIITEWIRNEVSSTKIRRALRRSESVKYLLPDAVIDYIQNNGLYGTDNKNKYMLHAQPLWNNVNLTPSPLDMSLDTPSPSINSTHCMNLCYNNIFNNTEPIDTPDNVAKTNQLNFLKQPGKAVKVVSKTSGQHQVIKDCEKEVGKANGTGKGLKSSKSCIEFPKIDKLKDTKSSESLGYKSCDENLIKFIFTRHGIQVISDVETIV